MKRILLIIYSLTILGNSFAQNSFIFTKEDPNTQIASSVLEDENGFFWVLVFDAESTESNYGYIVLDQQGSIIQQHNLVPDPLDNFGPTDFIRQNENSSLIVGVRQIRVNPDSLDRFIELQRINDSFEVQKRWRIDPKIKGILYPTITRVNDSISVVAITSTQLSPSSFHTTFGKMINDDLMISDTMIGYFIKANPDINKTGIIAGDGYTRRIMLLDDSLKEISYEHIYEHAQNNIFVTSLNDRYKVFIGAYNSNTSSSDYYVKSFDENLNDINTVKYGINGLPYNFQTTSIVSGIDKYNTNYIYTCGFYPYKWGSPTFEPEYSSIIQIANLDTNLNVRWFKMYGGDAYYRPYYIKATSDTGCIVAGYRYDTTGVRHSDFHVLKIGSDGESPLVSVEDEQPVPYDITVYPNPSSGLFMVRTGHNGTDLRLQMTDMQGNQVLATKLRNRENQFDLSHLVPGTYLYSIFDKNRLLGSSQWVKM